MIKTDGIEKLNARAKNVYIAKETINICKNKKYIYLNGNIVDFSSAMDAALQGTVLYHPNHIINKVNWSNLIPTIEVINETTSQAAMRLQSLGKTNIVALNFASATNPGGGFLGGAIAQEEDLCRASGLYPCLKSKTIFYNENILCNDYYYTDNIIYSPNVPFFRNVNNILLDSPFTLSIITSPAPNLNGAKEIDKEKLVEVLARRMDRILSIAFNHGHKNIILGAWGAGAFCNDPKMIATEFKNTLAKFPVFEHVCFAVYDIRTPPHVYETFLKVFK